METEIIVSPDVISVRAQVYGTVSRSIMQSSRAKSYTPLWSRFRALAIRAAPRDSHPNADFLRTSCGPTDVAAESKRGASDRIEWAPATDPAYRNLKK